VDINRIRFAEMSSYKMY